MRVVVDRDACQGYSQCNALVPEMFELDDDGIATTLSDAAPAELEDRVRGAVNQCPTAALRLIEHGS